MTTGIGGQYHSISYSGMELFARPLCSMVGGIVVDLASAPLPPGEHRLEIETGLGGVEIYLPRYAKFVIDGGAAVGGQDVHEGLPLWDRLFKRIKVAPAGHAEPVTIRIVIDSVIGGLDIYRV